MKTTACLLAMFLVATAAQAQSLRDITNRALRDVFVKQPVAAATEAVMGVDTSAKIDPYKRYWDDAEFTPSALDGYTHIRFGNSGASKYRYGVGGEGTCDGVVLLAALTQRELTSEQRETCRRREEWLQQTSFAANQTLLPGWPLPDMVVDRRLSDFGQLPLRLYYRFDIRAMKEERPDGIVFHFGNDMPLLGSGGIGSTDFAEPVTISVKGQDVVYEWETWTCATCSSKVRKHNDRGHVRVFARMSPEQRDAVLRSNRTIAWDTVFYTIHAVRQAPPIRGRPHFEVELTIDKVVLGMEHGHGQPTNVLAF